jgi:GMC oxidoreductase/FAD binding domain
MKLTTERSRLASGYQAVIIGSGAAGCVAAARLAAAGLSVCVLECGPESANTTDSYALFHIPDVGVLNAGERSFYRGARLQLRIGYTFAMVNFAGLGGSCAAVPRSLVPPEDGMLSKSVWPVRLRGDPDGTVSDGIQRAVGFMNSAGDAAVKSRLLRGYLRCALENHAHVFSRARVQSVQHESGRWQVFYNLLRFDGSPLRRLPACLFADIVVLAAGSPGSAEILLKSQSAGLNISSIVGQQIGFAACAEAHTSGSAIVQNPDSVSLDLLLTGTLGAVNQVIKEGGFAWNTSDPPTEMPDRPAGCRSLRLSLQQGGAVISAPGDSSAAPQGSAGKVSFLPFGGCVMADNATAGAVNDRGQVYSAGAGDRVYPGLYVLDESILPCSVGTDPLLTVLGIAERACALMLAERGLKLNCRTENPGAEAGKQTGAGVRLTEEMNGFISSRFGLDYEAAAAAGQADGNSISFSLCVECDCIDTLLEDSNHEARVTGMVVAPVLAKSPLKIVHGRFSMYQVQRNETSFRQMQYRLPIRAEDGAEYTLIAFRHIPGQFVLDVWPDMSTVYVTIMKGAGTDAPLWGSGILRTDLDQFTHQLNSMEAINVDGPLQRLETLVRFGRFYAGRLWDQLGGPFSGSARSDQP